MDLISKKCFKCGIVKDLSLFYKHKQMGDGHLNKCIDCTKKDSKEHEDRMSKNPEWVKKERKRHREKYYNLGYKEKHKPTTDKRRISMKSYYEKYPEKKNAKNKTAQMKPKIKGNNLHHWSYNDIHLKDVIEITPKDHYTIHRYMVYDQERKMYRTLEGVLLDTRESAINFYNKILKRENNTI